MMKVEWNVLRGKGRISWMPILGMFLRRKSVQLSYISTSRV